MGMDKHEALRNVASDGETEYIDLTQSQGIDECSEVIAHRIDGVGRLAARAGDPRIVEKDDGTPLRKPIRHKRIPVIKAAAEVLKEDERRSAFRAEAPICVADAISLDEAGWSRDVGVFRQQRSHANVTPFLTKGCARYPSPLAWHRALESAAPTGNVPISPMLPGPARPPRVPAWPPAGGV